MIQKLGAIALVAVVLTGCGMLGKLKPPVDQRTSHGPTAKTMWTYRMLLQNGREPNFEEQISWSDQLDRSISRYLAEHPESANSLDVMTFRSEKQVAVGMAKEQVMLLLGPPEGTTSDQAELQKLARKYWPMIQGNATEAWLYPLGWRFFFAGMKLIDITQYLSPDEP
jgi:hypothetical protein